MEIFIEFLMDNYIWFLVVCLVLVFALIGYLVDMTTNHKEKNKKNIDLIDNKVHPSVEVYTNETFDDPLISDK